MKNVLFTIMVMISIITIISSCYSKEERERIKQQEKSQKRELLYSDSIEKAQKLKLIDESIRYEKYMDSINRVNHIETIKKSIKITSYYLTSPNSASGVSAYFYYKNLSDKVIKYLTWEGYPINAVGDPVSCEIRGKSYFRGQDTGPIKKGKIGGGYWECAWYNSTAKKLILESIDIEYMDGSMLTITDDDLYLIGKKK